MKNRQCEDIKNVRMAEIESLLEQLLSLLVPTSAEEGQAIYMVNEKIEIFEVKLDTVISNQEDIKKELSRLKFLSSETSSSDSMCSSENSVCQEVNPDPRLLVRGRQGGHRH